MVPRCKKKPVFHPRAGEEGRKDPGKKKEGSALPSSEAAGKSQVPTTSLQRKKEKRCQLVEVLQVPRGGKGRKVGTRVPSNCWKQGKKKKKNEIAMRAYPHQAFKTR